MQNNNQQNAFNPAVFMAQSLMKGLEIDEIYKQIESQGARYARIIGMMRGKDAQGLQAVAKEVAKEYNVDLNAALGQFGINIQ